MKTFRTFLLGAAALSAVAIPAAALGAGNGAGGVTGPAIYVDGTLYRTVGTPAHFEGTGAPDHSYDTIYAIVDSQGSSLQPSVATAAPGDRDYNGGRWHVTIAQFADYAAAVAMYDSNMSGDLDSDQEVEAAIAGGAAMTAAGPWFECPVIPLPGPRGG